MKTRFPLLSPCKIQIKLRLRDRTPSQYLSKPILSREEHNTVMIAQ